MTMPSPEEQPAARRLWAKTWFGLTDNERRAIVVVLGLFLLGLGARAWHLGRVSAQPPPESRAAEPQCIRPGMASNVGSGHMFPLVKGVMEKP